MRWSNQPCRFQGCFYASKLKKDFSGGFHSFDFVRVFFNGICWLFPLLNGGLGRAGCGGEMFPSSGGRTDPGGGFRPRAGVRVPLHKLPREVGPCSPGTPANTTASSVPLHSMLSCSRPRGQDMQTRRANTAAFSTVFFVRWVVKSLAAAGTPVEWELLVLSPSPGQPHPAQSLFTS